jgi:hypothetical protein
MKNKVQPLIYKNMAYVQNKAIVLTDRYIKNEFAIYETCLFTKCREKDLGNLPLSELLPYLRFIATEHFLNLSRTKDFQKAKTILFNSVNFN